MTDRNDERSSPRAGGGSGASPFADLSSFRETWPEKSAKPLGQNARLLLLRFEWSVRRLLRSSGVQWLKFLS